MARRVVVTGASGFVGSHLARALSEDGHQVVAVTRHPRSYVGAGEPLYGDVGDPASLTTTLAGAEAAYYLVHSLKSADFVEKAYSSRKPPKAAFSRSAGQTSSPMRR